MSIEENSGDLNLISSLLAGKAVEPKKKGKPAKDLPYVIPPATTAEEEAANKANKEWLSIHNDAIWTGVNW